jgi:hypothetical protein
MYEGIVIELSLHRLVRSLLYGILIVRGLPAAPMMIDWKAAVSLVALPVHVGVKVVDCA